VLTNNLNGSLNGSNIQLVNVNDVLNGNNVNALNNALDRNNVQILALRDVLNNVNVIALNGNTVTLTNFLNNNTVPITIGQVVTSMPGGGQLFIETEDVVRPVLAAGGSVSIAQYVAIYIRDTGVGMDEDTRQHAFEPFYTTKEVGRGTGLGLATVYGIVQQCGGEISIQSTPGKGTQVNILLPATATAASLDHEDAGQETKKGHGRILLVEDEPELRNVNAEYLTSLGYSVTCAGSGPEALELAAQNRAFDLVISDVIMPKMNGREFADRLLQLRPNTKLLYVSGYADAVVLDSGVPMQGMTFLQKPYSLRQLAGKVQSLLFGTPRPV